MNIFRPLIQAAVLTLSAAGALAEDVPLFSSEEPINAVLSLPLTDAYKQAKQDTRLYLPGHIAYKDDAGETVRVPVRSRARGVFRRQNCVRPPLRLNFKKTDVPGTVFEDQDKLKLVNPCSNRSSSEQLLALEYLTYKLYEVISDHSFHTRLLKLSYQDTQGKMKPWTTMTFVIEDEGELLKRLGGEALKEDKVSRRSFNLSATAKVDLFQYMIGNTDYSLYRSAPGRDCCHNIKLANEGDEASPRYIPVPYDFDSSGIVNAPYANPPENLPIKKVSQRFYMGYCRDPAYLDEAIAHFQERRDEILAVFDSELINDKTRKRAVKYINDFYKIIDSPKQAKKKLYDKCRGKLLT